MTVEHSEREMKPTNMDVTKVEVEATKEEMAKVDADATKEDGAKAGTAAPGGLLQCLSQEGAWGASLHHCLCQGCYFPDWPPGGTGSCNMVPSLVRLPEIRR